MNYDLEAEYRSAVSDISGSCQKLQRKRCKTADEPDKHRQADTVRMGCLYGMFDIAAKVIAGPTAASSCRTVLWCSSGPQLQKT